ncbi:hypothetical protein SLS56_007742 [Neofusicoccum ribis]|uniref:Uncharacterized protein n=1 Tax=Neofusicoccum ribis TaxID=45134 RepID=A0ABR3SM73_9PEZI
MRKVYKPAELWLNQLMGIVSPDIRYAEDRDNNKPFKDYFARFADTQEVPYLEMNFQKEMPARGHSGVNTTEVTQPRGESQRSISENEGSTETDAWISQYHLDLEDQICDSSESNVNSGERTAYEIQQLSSQLVLQQTTPQGFLDNTDDLLISSSSVPLPQDDWAYASMDLFLDDTTWDIETALYSAMSI